MQEVSAANRTTADLFIRRQSNQGIRSSTLYHYANTIRRLDRHLNGRPFASVQPEDMDMLFADLRDQYKPATVLHYSIQTRAFLRWVLKTKDLPDELDEATYVRESDVRSRFRILSVTEFHGLLDATRRHEGRFAKLARVERTQAILWTLWDTGFRASELLSLTVGSVAFEDAHGARLNLPEPDATPFSLKRGPRTVYVVECVGPLRAWLDMHPAADDPAAPLFPHAYSRKGTDPTRYQSLNKLIERTGNAAGVNGDPNKKKVTAHDFRHTLATRKAKAGWVEAQMRAYFGWSPTSKMPSFYVHLALADMRDRVRRDAGVDDLGYARTVETGDDAAQLRALLRRMLTDSDAPNAARTRRPADHELP